jgi:hypothetical protein
MWEGTQSFPGFSGQTTFQHFRVFSNLEALQTLSFGFLWKVHCIGMID